MLTDDHRKEGKPEAKTEGLERNSLPLANSVMVSNIDEEEYLLPSKQHSYIAKIENVVSDENIQRAVLKVKRNKGAPGIDNIMTSDLDKVMRERWPKVKQEILEGKYLPSPVKRVEIPKPDGGVRQLGIPTVLDRVIQQALTQELTPVFEPLFSEQSYGFRPNKNAHQAVLKAQEYIHQGCNWVVDIDLERFFDKVNHDMLMARVVRKVKDKEILRLIRRFLQAGVMEGGLVSLTEEGTPQGGPISPLLSNIMLDDFDKELEKRKLRFVRYADDCNIYVKTERAGIRVMESAVNYLIKKLKLKVNQQKSAVDNPSNRKFLGFTFTKGSKGKPSQIKVHESRVKRFKDKVRKLKKPLRGANMIKSIKKLIMPITRGWASYFGIAEIQRIFKDLDGWIRRRIRAVLWRQWKTPITRYRNLVTLGLSISASKKNAYSYKGPWRMARTRGMHAALSNQKIEDMGYTPMETIARMKLARS